MLILRVSDPLSYMLIWWIFCIISIFEYAPQIIPPLFFFFLILLLFESSQRLHHHRHHRRIYHRRVCMLHLNCVVVM